MSDDVEESKAKKLAAARKKLKEYQSRNMEKDSTPTTNMTSSTNSIASSERSETEILRSRADTPNSVISNEAPPIISSYFSAPTKETAFGLNLTEQPKQNAFTENSNGSTEILVTSNNTATASVATQAFHYSHNQQQEQQHQLVQQQQYQLQQHQQQHELIQQQQQQQQTFNAMQLLINEKTQLTAELNRWRTLCRERDDNLEELRTQLTSTNQQFEDFKQSTKQQTQNCEQLRKLNAELMHKLSQANAVQEDHVAHCAELQQQLKLSQNQVNMLEEQITAKCKEFEMAQLRLQQISNEANSPDNDSRIETLTQNQFMYEQQIRDLQAMVQQFTQDKEQSSAQYQNYVQHLNAEVATVNERNSELTDECTKLQERERQLIEHVSSLEREIQKNLSLRQKSNEMQTSSNESNAMASELIACKEKIEKLQESINDLEFERHEFQLKIKSQEDNLVQLQQNLNERELQLEHVTEHMSQQPDQVKLLATMESDKVAASRALAQNVALKKQLDELELRFVQLTNDKAELTNELDKEKFENREMRVNFESLTKRVKNLDERFQYKDEEMIRLSHENMELTSQNLSLQQQIKRLKHVEHEEDSHHHEDENEHEHEIEHEDNENGEHCRHKHVHNEHKHVHEDHQHHHDHENSHESVEHEEHRNHKVINSNYISCEGSEIGQEARENDVIENVNSKPEGKSKPMAQHIATEEAVEKLQARFTKLMSQVADLTDEKQRLEHLVLQLQGETETIGEYITLYQTQRRILKQREYEKAAQTRLLQEERERLREQIGQLNQLVIKLGLLENRPPQQQSDATISDTATISKHLNAALAESISIDPCDANHADNASSTNEGVVGDVALSVGTKNTSSMPMPEANEILMQIQNIVTEIKENTTNGMQLFEGIATDHCQCCEGQLKVV